MPDLPAGPVLVEHPGQGPGWRVWLFWLGVLSWAGSVAWAASALPDGQIPTHWSGSTPDSYATRGQAVAMFVGVGLLLLAIFGGIAVVLGRSRSLTGFNIPYKSYWARPENVAAAVRMSRDDMLAIGGWTLLLIACVVVSVVEAAHDAEEALPGWTMVALVLFMVGIVAFLAHMLLVRWRPPSPR